MKTKVTNKPFFSIITCTKNSDKYIKKTTDSVMNQTFSDYEHIFVDGYSTDNTKKLLAAYKKTSKNIKILNLTPAGVTSAMNLGIKESRGVYIIHLNSDDYFHDNNVLMDVYNFLIEHPKLDWIYGKISIVDINNKEIGIFPKNRLFHFPSVSLLKLINYIPHQSVFIKRKIFNKFGFFDEKYSVMPDYEYWLRISSISTWGYFERIVSNYRAWSGAGTYDKKMQKINRDTIVGYHRRYTGPIMHASYIIANLILVPLYLGIKNTYAQRFKK